MWIVLTHIIPPLAGQRLDLLGYLDAIGRRQTAITVPSSRPLDPPLPAEAILYDFSDGERLQGPIAMSFGRRVEHSDR